MKLSIVYNSLGLSNSPEQMAPIFMDFSSIPDSTGLKGKCCRYVHPDCGSSRLPPLMELSNLEHSSLEGTSVRSLPYEEFNYLILYLFCFVLFNCSCKKIWNQNSLISIQTNFSTTPSFWRGQRQVSPPHCTEYFGETVSVLNVEEASVLKSLLAGDMSNSGSSYFLSKILTKI